jgi:hypothetical protein
MDMIRCASERNAPHFSLRRIEIVVLGGAREAHPSWVVDCAAEVTPWER